MVDIMYRHGPESSLNNKIIQKETNIYISDDRFHDLHYVQHYFQIFYGQLKEVNIQMDQLGYGQMVVWASSKISESCNG